jgi:hypothetical protein
MVELSELEKALLSSWLKETSLDPENWTPQNPAWGQCAVTACVVQDYLGGEIVWAEVIDRGKTISHYFNKIDGIEHDLTHRQFSKGTKIPEGIPKTKGLPTTRDYILSYEPTCKRYAILKDLVEDYIERYFK